MSILFVPTLGKGIGHVKRALNIIHSIGKNEKNINTSIVVDSILSSHLKNQNVNQISLPIKNSNLFQEKLNENGVRNPEYSKIIYSIIDGLKPDIVVFDFVISEPIFNLIKSYNGKIVLILREQKEIFFKNLISSQILDYIDKIIIPHNPSAFNLNNTPYASKAISVGRIYNNLNILFDSGKQVREKMAIPFDAFWIIASIGGGGYCEEFEQILDLLIRISSDSRVENSNFLISYFKGIYSVNNSSVNRLLDKNIQINDFTFDLPSYYPYADLIISFAGYNSCHEISLTRTPAILIPKERAIDDQYKRAEQFSKFKNIRYCQDIDNVKEIIVNAINRPNNVFSNIDSDLNNSSLINGAEIAAKELIKLHHDSNKKSFDIGNNAVVFSEQEIINFKASFEKYFFKGITSFYFDESHLTRNSLLNINTIERSLNENSIEYKFRVLNKNYIKELSKPDHPLIEHVNLRITQSCNSKCIYCYHWKLNQANPHMPTLKVLDIAYQAKALGAKSIVLNGGEPTLHPDLYSITDALVNIGYKITINTNGSKLLNRKFINSFVKSKPISFMVTILSIKDVGLRGIPDWSCKVINAIKEIKTEKKNVFIRVNIIVTNKNIMQLNTITKKLVNARVDQITINLIDSVLNVNNEYLSLNKKQLTELYFKILPRLIFITSRNKIKLKINPIFLRIAYNIAKKSNYSAWRHIIDLMSIKYLVSEEINYFSNGLYGKYFYETVNECFIPKNNVYVMANGDIYPCLRAIGEKTIKPYGNLYFRRMKAIIQSRKWQEYQKMAGRHNLCQICNNAFIHNLKQIV